ncbi:MAG: Clp protease N-terminal domain-containing protein [Oscillospiraceae bacterium]
MDNILSIYLLICLSEGVCLIKSNEKFTQRAELAIENARIAAGELGHGYVGTEHLLLGIMMEQDGLGAGCFSTRVWTRPGCGTSSSAPMAAAAPAGRSRV